MVKRYRPFGSAMTRSNDGEWVRHDDVLTALQTLIDQLATNHEWRNGAVLAYNAISCSEQETACEHEWRSTQESYGEDADGNRGVMVAYEICTKCRARRDEL